MENVRQLRESHVLYVDHVLIKNLRVEISTAILMSEDPEVVLELCRTTHERIRRHIEMEERILHSTDFSDIEIKRHTDHHKLILGLLDNECHLIETQNAHAGPAINVFNEIMIKHETLFDNALCTYLLVAGR